jgi:hypothetical protein
MDEIEISSWLSEAEGNEKVKNILRVWFSLFKPYSQ